LHHFSRKPGQALPWQEVPQPLKPPLLAKLHLQGTEPLPPQAEA
jgi:hypothetical protein